MKKWIALLLAVCMLFALVACGGTATPTEQTEDEGDTQAMKGFVDGSYHGELPLVPEGETKTLTIGLTNNGRVTDFYDNAFTKWVEEKTGIHLEFVVFPGTAKDAATQVSLMVAADEELPDILWAFSGINKATGEDYGKQGYFADLKPYFDEGMNYYQQESMKRLFGDDAENVYHLLMDRGIDPATGGLYDFPTMEEVPLDTPRYHTWINQQWLDNLGLEAPKTTDELYDVLVAFRDNDPNGNGQKDEIPMVGVADANYTDVVNYVINAFVYCDNSYYYNVTDGKIWAPYDTDEYREAMIFVNKLVAEGLLSPLTWTQSATELKSLINGDNGSYNCGIIAGHADMSFEFGNDSIFIYNPLHPLAAATDKGGYCPRASYTQKYITRITDSCEDPELAFKFLDFCMSEEAYLRQRWGELGVDWEWSDGTKAGNLGGTAKINILHPTMWSEENNACWHVVASVSSEKYYEFEVDYSDLTDWDTNRALKLLENYNNAVDAGQPEEVFTVVTYTQDEYDRLTEVQSDVREYIKSSRTQFANGIMDPSDDATWQSYLDNLKGLGYYDAWMEPAQAAYTRTIK